MLGSSILVSLASLFVSLIGFANQIVLAKLFGASMHMDTYLIAISIPMFVSGVLSVGLSYSLVPAFILHKPNRDSYRRFAGLLFITLVFVAGVIAGIGFFAAPVQIAMLGSTLSAAARPDAITMARVSWLTAGVMLVVGHLRAMHNADQRFLLATFASVVPFICTIGAGLAFAPTHGPVVVAWAMLAGFLLVIPLMLVHTLSEIDLSRSCLLLWNEVAGFLSRAPWIIVAMLCFTVFQSIDAYWAPQIGTGNLAYLGYCQRIVVALGNLVIAGPAAVILPRLAAAYAEGRIPDLLNDTLRAVRMVAAFALPVAISVSLLAAPMVQLLFERGAFDPHATQGVAALLPLMMLGMVAMLCVVMIFRALFAKHDILWASMLGGLTTIMYFALSGLLSQWLGAVGIALAYALTWWLVLILSIVTLWRGAIKLLFCRENFLFVGQLMVLVAIIASVVAGGNIWITTTHAQSWLLMLQLVAVAVVSATMYCILAIRVLKVEEIRLIYKFTISKFVLFIA